MFNLQAEINRLLSSELTNIELEEKILSLDHEYGSQFRQLDGTWALRIYERSPYIFSDFIAKHLSADDHREVIETLLERTEADNQDQLFQKLYPKIANPERYNQDVAWLVANAPDFGAIIHGMQLRRGDWTLITEDTLTALYRRDPEAFEQNVQSELLYTYHYSLFKLPPGKLEHFRQMLGRKYPNTRLYTLLFQRFATSEEWYAEVRRLMRAHPRNIVHELQIRHPHDSSMQLPPDLLDALVRTFGNAVLPYLNHTSPVYIRRRLEDLFQSEKDDGVLFNKLQEFARMGAPFQALTPFWAPYLYRRNTDLFENFILWNAESKPESLTALLTEAQRDGSDAFYRKIYAKQAEKANWNTEIKSILQSGSGIGTLMRDLDRLDIQQERRNQQTIFLNDQNAAALYHRGLDLFQEFIWRYLPTGPHEYPLLIQAVEESGDMDFFRRIFRKVASSSHWEAEMKHLLEQNLPPDQILEALEQRKPADVKQVNPAVLAEFMEKYGEAVLPFFELYLDWTSPARLTALLDLDIDRAELLRELQAIVRRQPAEFVSRANIWAPRLYEKSPDFFGSFIARHLTWETKALGHALLRRFEADGQDKLFREVYARFYYGHEWEVDIARLLGSGMDNATLLDALQRRISRWNQLPDNLATDIYLRDPNLFRELVIEGLGNDSGYGQQAHYQQLRKAAEDRHDTVLIDAINQRTSSAKLWKQEMELLLKANVSADQIVEELTRRMPRNYWQLDDMSILAKFVEKYGDSVMPFLMSENVRHSNVRSDRSILKAVERFANKGSYWRFVFGYQGGPKLWKEALEKLASERISETEFQSELAYLTPDESPLWSRWQLEPQVAARLYSRYPNAARSFIERFLNGYSAELYQQAQRNQDEDFLDFLTYRMMLTINELVFKAFPVPNRWQQNPPDEKARVEIVDITRTVTARFDALYKTDPQLYIRRAAHMLSFLEPFGFRSWGRSKPSSHNQVWQYLRTSQHDAWRRSRAGITELLESPNIHVQLMALDILSAPSPEAAQRVIENLPAFRALLLSNVRKATKEQVLVCLEAAVQANPETARLITPLLKETMNFVARRAVPDEITVAYARLQQEETDAG